MAILPQLAFDFEGQSPKPAGKCCPRCKQAKSVCDFGVASGRRDGRQAYCRTCRAEIAAASSRAEKLRQAEPKPGAKLCECGCGLPAPIAPQTLTAKGWVKGQPLRFIVRHYGGRKVPGIADRTERRCPRCQIVKAIGAFGISTGRGDGHAVYCLECVRKQSLEHYRANLEKERARARAYSKRYYHSHKEQISAKNKERYLTNRDHLVEYSRQWRAENHDRSIETNRAWKARHKEHLREYDRAKWARMPEDERKALRKKYSQNAQPARRRWEQDNRDYVRMLRREWGRRNPDRISNKNFKRRARKLNAPEVEQIDRAALIARDKATCYLCGRVLVDERITLDHVIPLTRQGAHTAANLRVACVPCNSRKGTRLLSELDWYPTRA